MVYGAIQGTQVLGMVGNEVIVLDKEICVFGWCICGVYHGYHQGTSESIKVAEGVHTT